MLAQEQATGGTDESPPLKKRALSPSLSQSWNPSREGWRQLDGNDDWTKFHGYWWPRTDAKPRNAVTAVDSLAESDPNFTIRDAFGTDIGQTFLVRDCYQKLSDMVDVRRANGISRGLVLTGQPGTGKL